MVKVWYEPPPFGPRTTLSRPAYGISGDAVNPQWLVRMSKAPQWQVITGSILVFSVLAYIPLCTSVHMSAKLCMPHLTFDSLLDDSGSEASIHHVARIPGWPTRLHALP